MYRLKEYGNQNGTVTMLYRKGLIFSVCLKNRQIRYCRIGSPVHNSYRNLLGNIVGRSNIQIREAY